MKQYERQDSFEKELEIRNITPNDVQSYLDDLAKKFYNIIFIPIQVLIIILAVLPIERTDPNAPTGYYLVVGTILVLMIEAAKRLGIKFGKAMLNYETLKLGYESGNSRSIVTLDKVQERVKEKEDKSN